MRNAVLVAAIVAIAQQGAAQQIDYTRRPDVPPPAPFHFPTIHPHTLANGLRVLVVEDHSIPLVSARVLLPDASTDPVGKEGLDSLMIAVLREGTTTRDATQLAEAFADIGAPILPTRFTVTTDGAPTAMMLVADMLMHPAFDSGAVERRRSMQAAVARSIALSPSTAARRAFYSILYGATGDVTRSLFVDDARINALTRDDLVEHYRRFVGPKSTTIVLVGDLTDASALALVTRAFSTWDSEALPAAVSSSAAATAATAPTTIYLVDVPAALDVTVLVGNTAPPRATPDFYAADVAAAVATMRMQESMRVRRQLMYSGVMGMIWRSAARPSTFVGATRFTVAKTDTALVTWLAFLRELHGGSSITPAELDAARRSLLGALTGSIDGPDLIADRVAELARTGAAADYYDTYYREVTQQSENAVDSVATKFIDVDHLTIVVAGRRAALEPTLRAANIAPIVVVNADGSRAP